MHKYREYKIEDINKIAIALIVHSEYESGRYDYCRYCDQIQFSTNKNHKLDCPILIAKDVLTNSDIEKDK